MSNLLEAHTLACPTQISNAELIASPSSSELESDRSNISLEIISQPAKQVVLRQHHNSRVQLQRTSSNHPRPSSLQCGSVDRSSQDASLGAPPFDTLDEPDLDPPVTKDTLQVLELPRIINDPKLRYDLCFDENIEFKPATNCPHGCEKYRKGQEYYQALRIELVTLLDQRSDVVLGDRNIQLTRIPRMFESIRETLEDLCPAAEMSAINEQLDPEWLMQQIQHGVLNFAKLGEWLCQLLMRSCAPLRDNFIKGIGNLLREASLTNSADCLLNGIKRIFGALELMKLVRTLHKSEIIKYGG